MYLLLVLGCFRYMLLQAFQFLKKGALYRLGIGDQQGVARSVIGVKTGKSYCWG